jgi:NAD(P)H-hydrate epimerase
MVEAEKTADAAGHSYADMMETAGRLVAEAVIERYSVGGANVSVLVGPGNNGGDGLVAGRYLAEAGADVAFYLFKERDPQNDENFTRIQQMGLFQVTAEFDQRFRVLRTRLNITDIVIDALLGTGVSRPITGDLAQLLKQAKAGIAERSEQNEEPKSLQSLAATSSPHVSRPVPLVVAVDCPSGLNCDTGELDPLAIPAHLTVTFAGPKRGHFIFPGASACGELVVADIGITEEMVREVKLAVMTAVAAQSLLLSRPADGHKGTFGKVLIAAGSEHYWGAPLLSGRAAYRVGAGLVALAVPEKIRPVIATQLPEATYPPVPDAGKLGEGSAQFLLENIASYKAMLFGPGLDDAPEFLRTLLQSADALPPLVVDADGLNLLAQLPDWHKQLPANSILTPHPGEMARLMGLALDALKEMERVEVAQTKAAEWGHIVLLKGAYTVVAAPDGRCMVIPFANSALGVAGSGDVLAGVIVGLLGQGMAAWEAAVLGAYVHGAAGETYGKASGLIASEIADFIPEVMQNLR